jgi:hypothetical protein
VPARSIVADPFVSADVVRRRARAPREGEQVTGG